MKLRDANLQVNEKNYFTHPPSCTLSSFSKNTSRLLLPRSLWKRANTIFFRKYKRVTCNLPVQYNSSKSTFSILYMQHLGLGQFPPRKIAPNPKLTLIQTLTLTGGLSFSWTIFWLTPNLKTNPNLWPKPQS